MKVFISWSGIKSKTVAEKLHQWIPDVIQDVEPWMSESDIGAGARWGKEIAEELSEPNFGIVCLTKTNVKEPWIHFEAGALSKTIDNTYVCPYLIEMETTDVPAGPLNQFQAKKADKNGTFALISTMNDGLNSNRHA